MLNVPTELNASMQLFVKMARDSAAMRMTSTVKIPQHSAHILVSLDNAHTVKRVMMWMFVRLPCLQRLLSQRTHHLAWRKFVFTKERLSIVGEMMVMVMLLLCHLLTLWIQMERLTPNQPSMVWKMLFWMTLWITCSKVKTMQTIVAKSLHRQRTPLPKMIIVVAVVLLDALS